MGVNKLLTIKDKAEWETFLLSCPDTPFFQSWEWGEAQIACDDKIHRLGLYENDKLVLICQILEVHAKRGYYLHIRQGPVMKRWDKKYFETFVSEIKELGSRRGVNFIRAGFLMDGTTDNLDYIHKLGFKDRIGQNQDAENTLIVDLSGSIDDIQKEMRKNTRYYVRRATKEGVKIEKIATYGKKVEEFIEFYKESSGKIGYVPHKGLAEEFKHLSKDHNILLINANYNGETIASGFFIYYGKKGVYHHSATSNKYPKIPGSYLMLWTAIEEAKNRGLEIFDLWGVVGEDQKNHPWYGFSLFKRGFSKKENSYLYSQDLQLSFRYRFIRLYEWIESKRKGY